MCPASVGTSRRALETGEAKLWALLVGVNQYADETLPDLAYSALDCQGLAEAIVTATQAFPQKAVRVHHDFATPGQLPQGQERSGRSLPDQVAVAGRLGLETIAKLRNFPASAPKRATVEASLNQILQAAQPQDTVLFYFSGHGMLDPETRQAFLCLADTDRDKLAATGLGMQALLNRLNQCQAHQQIVWLDACHSGGMTLRGITEALPNPTPQLLAVLQQQAARSQGFYALLSCDQNQLSWEFPELGHGVFTYYLMRGLLGEAANAQGMIEADALYKYVYYQTLRYIDKTNQQLRLINQQKRGRGELQLQPEYPLQTPKRIVEGIGELIIGTKSNLTTVRYPRQALVVEGLANHPATLAIGKILRSSGNFELTYYPQPGKDWSTVRSAIQTCLQSEASSPTELTYAETALLYLRGQIQSHDSGEDCLVVRQVEISRSWLRQELRRSSVARQVVILDCPGATNLDEWIEDLQLGSGPGQCLIAVASPESDSDWFTRTLLETLQAAEPQSGLSIAGWIAQLQLRAAEAGVKPQVWLSGTQGVIEVLPSKIGMRGDLIDDFDLGICPYLGLRAFSEEDAPFFYGRETLVQQLIQQVMQQPFLAVVGASGSGKSSVVQAGLMAQLRQGQQVPGSETWWLGSLRPGTTPIQALAQRLSQSETEQLQLEGMLYQGVEGFVYWLRTRPEPMLLLVVDQFEELFTLAAADDRQKFLELVLGAIEHAGDRFKLVITLRSDFVASALEDPALAQWLQQASLLVPPTLSEDDYRQVILRPAEQVGLQVEPELVEVLLQELDQSAADLPLLEFVLEQLWEKRQPGQLTLQVYQQQIGGLKGALERKAQALYDSLDSEAQACARWIFLSLTQLGEGTEDTRRRIHRSDLIVKKYSPELVDRTLQALVAAKLVVVSADEVSSDQPALSESTLNLRSSKNLLTDASGQFPPVSIEVAHEILIRHWSTLRWWLEENRSRLRAQRQIQQAAAQWWQSGQQSDFLLRGVRLDAAEELYVKYTDELSQDVQQFIEAGLAERDREQKQTKQRLRRAQAAIVLIGSLGIAAAGFGGFAYWQRQKAFMNQISTLNALSESQLLANQQLEALTTSLKAGYQLQQMNWFGINSGTVSEIKTQTIATLQQAVEETQESNRLEGHSDRVTTVAVSADNWIVSGSDDGTVRFWQPNGAIDRTIQAGERVTAVGMPGDRMIATTAAGKVLIWNRLRELERSWTTGNWITSFAVSHNREWLVTGSRDRSIKLWNLNTGQLIKTWTGDAGFVNTVQFSPDDRIIASAGEAGSIKLWTLQGKLIRTLTGHQGRVSQIAFSSNGQQLVSAGEDRIVRLWDLQANSANLMKLLGEHSQPIAWVGFNSKGQILSASYDKTLKLWQDGSLIATLQGHGDAVLSAAFSADDRFVISGSADKTVRVWDLQNLQPVDDQAYAIDFSSKGNEFVSGSETGEITLWQTPARQIKTWKGHDGMISAIDFSPNSNQIISAGDDRTIKLWNADGTLKQTLSGHSDRVTTVQFSPDGQWLASGSDDKTVRIWRSDGHPVRVMQGHGDAVATVAWSPDGHLASGSYDRTVKLWRSDGTLVRTLTGHSAAISTVTFSPNGKLIASASWDNTIKIWRTQDGTLLHTLTGHRAGVTALTFTADSRTIVSGSGDRTIKLWNVSEGSLIKTLIGAEAAISSLKLSPDGKTLLTTDEAHGIQLWDLNLADLLQQGCDRMQNYLHMGKSLAESERSTCASDHLVRSDNHNQPAN